MWEIIIKAIIKQIEEHPEKIVELVGKIIDLISKIVDHDPEMLVKIAKAFKPKE